MIVALIVCPCLLLLIPTANEQDLFPHKRRSLLIHHATEYGLICPVERQMVQRSHFAGLQHHMRGTCCGVPWRGRGNSVLDARPERRERISPLLIRPDLITGDPPGECPLGQVYGCAIDDRSRGVHDPTGERSDRMWREA